LTIFHPLHVAPHGAFRRKTTMWLVTGTLTYVVVEDGFP
jgi:hypothetical protein